MGARADAALVIFEREFFVWAVCVVVVLAPAEQQQVAAEILRRTAGTGELPEAALDELAAEASASGCASSGSFSTAPPLPVQSTGRRPLVA